MYNIRLASTLSLDENSEADIIKMIEQLNSKHKMGEFITSLFRIAVDNPDLLVKNCSNGAYSEGSVVRAVETIGKTKVRAEYIKETKEEVKNVEKKIDEIYQMCSQIKTAFEFGKRNGLEQNTDTILSTTFIIENHLKKLKKVVSGNLNLTMTDTVEERKKFENNVENTLEFILKSYEPVISELIRVASSVRTNPVQEVKVTVEQPVYQPVQQIIQPVQEIKDTKEVVKDVAQEVVKESSEVDIKPTDFIIDNDESEEVDFSNADFSALANFFST